MAWATNKILISRQKIISRFLLIFFGLLFLGTTYAVIADNNYTVNNAIDDVQTPLVLGTVMGAVGNIDDPVNAEKVGRQTKHKMWIISEDQYDDSQAFPARNGREVGNIPLKSGETWHYIESVLDSLQPAWTAEAGEVASLINNRLPFIIGGMDDATLNLLENGINKGFYIVWEKCGSISQDKYLGGTGCKPMKLISFDGGSTNDNTSTSLVFENQCGEIFSKYVGNLPTQSPEVVAADATSITLTDNPRYQLTDGSAAADITTVTATSDSDIGRVITVLGSGGSFPPTISSGGDFLLIGGEQWTANANSQISFKIFKDGGATYKYMEIAGTRT